MNREIFREQLRGNIQEILKKRNISQVELQKKCKESGYSISQPEISKVLSGKTSATIYQLSAFSKALDIPLDYFLYGEQEERTFYFKEDKAFVTSPLDEAYNGYMGVFHVLFRSTSPFEDKWLHGKLSFFSSDESQPICIAELEIDTGESNKRGKPIIKFYEGQFVISRKMGTGYCIMLNSDIGEMVIIEFRHRNFLVRQVECRLGLMISCSSGEEKVPVVQKILLSRTPFSEDTDQEAFAEIAPCLKFVQGEVFISKERYEKIRSEYRQYSIPDAKGKEELSYYLVNEEMIQGGNRKNRFEIAKLISILRDNAESPWIYNLTEREDSLVYSIIQEQKEKLL